MEQYFDNLNFHIQNHEKYPGTGGAVMGVEFKHKKVLVLNGDMPLVKADELKNLITNKPLSMSVLRLEDADGYGRVVIKKDKVIKIVEQKDCLEDELKINIANAGVYCFDVDFLSKNLPKLTNNNNQKEYYITDLIQIAVKNNLQIEPIFVNKDNFKGVNTKLDLANAITLHQNKIKDKLLLSGVEMILPNTIYIEDDVDFDGQCVLENGVTLLGKTQIINSHIKTNTIVEDSIIKDSTIGPMARVRPQSTILNSKVGNFVEIKKSKLDGVKAGHLSYLGDSVIKDGANIGAGTITCNYDGISKHKTTIGKNVFIGSATQLIAPITLEDNSIVGAGSTLTKDVKSGELVLTRAKTKTIKGYFYKFFSFA
jgi:bifunctional UDP-N-acetylglucosamine pyrophosphorylase/glucosamine-1-phosphate N-acetyltransferase